MKKGTLYKILTLIIAFAAFSCCSGCVRWRAEGAQMQAERKAIAEALEVEIEGYSFFASHNKTEGYFHYDDMFGKENNQNYYYEREEDDLFVTFLIKTDYRTVAHKIVIQKDEYYERLGKYFEFFSEIGYQGDVICYDGEVFLVSWMIPEPLTWAMDVNGPPAFFLVDFEKNTIHYVGYAKGWLEYEIEAEDFTPYPSSYCYKIVKE